MTANDGGRAERSKCTKFTLSPPKLFVVISLSSCDRDALMHNRCMICNKLQIEIDANARSAPRMNSPNIENTSNPTRLCHGLETGVRYVKNFSLLSLSIHACCAVTLSAEAALNVY